MLENEIDALAKANEIDDKHTYTVAKLSDRVSEVLNMNVWKLSVENLGVELAILGVMYHIAADGTLFTMPVLKLEAEEFAAKVQECYSNRRI